MNRIDADDFIILFVQWGDHLHRYAIPTRYDLGLASAKVIDSLAPTNRKSGSFFRKPGTFFTMSQGDETTLLPRRTNITVFDEGATVRIYEVKEA